MEINHCLFTLLRDRGTKAVQYCCVAKETQQCCTSALLRSRAPTSRCYRNHNTQQYVQSVCMNNMFIYFYASSGVKQSEYLDFLEHWIHISIR
jgi:hypothetical protein